MTPPARLPGAPLLLMAACLALFVALLAGLAQAAEGPQFPPLTGRVVDAAGLLSPAERQSLTDTLAAHEEATGSQIVVATVRSLQGMPIEDYGYQLGRAWGIGRAGKDNGALLIVAPNERKVRIEVGYGLEGELTDAASKLIIERIMLPSFRSGQFGPGIAAGVGAILKVVGGGEGAAQPDEKKPVTNKPAKATRLADVLIPAAFLIFFLLVVASSYRRQQRFGRGQSPGGRASDWVILGSGLGGGLGGHRGGWGGGDGGGFGGGGGFSGGGSFGGGGASGDW